MVSRQSEWVLHFFLVLALHSDVKHADPDPTHWELKKRVPGPPITGNTMDFDVVVTSLSWADSTTAHLLVSYRNHGVW